MTDSQKTVLILCTGNSCRSQMAQVIWQDLGQGDWQAISAGSDPSGYVHPLAITAIEELGLSTEGLRSKKVDEFYERKIDLAVTVCDNAKAACRVMPGVCLTLHWPFEDPADATGTDDEKMAQFRKIRDQIKTKIKDFLQESKTV